MLGFGLSTTSQPGCLTASEYMVLSSMFVASVIRWKLREWVQYSLEASPDHNKVIGLTSYVTCLALLCSRVLPGMD